MILCTMRTGRRVNGKTRISDNRGMTLVELVVVMAILIIMVGISSLGISILFNREADYVASRLDDGLTEARMLSMSKNGEFTYELHINNSKPTTSYVSIVWKKSESEAPEIYKKIPLDKSVTITVTGEDAAPGADPVEEPGEDPVEDSEETPSEETDTSVFKIKFDKAKGCVDEVNGSEDISGVYRIRATSTRNTSKYTDVILITTTGRHHTKQ